MHQISSLLENTLFKVLKRHVLCEYGLLCASHVSVLCRQLNLAVKYVRTYVHTYVHTYVCILYLSAISIAGVLQCRDHFVMVVNQEMSHFPS